MRPGKHGRIGNEAPRLGPAAIETEVVNLQHSLTPLTRSEMLLGLTPGLKGRCIQIGVMGSLVVEESVQGFESAHRVVET